MQISTNTKQLTILGIVLCLLLPLAAITVNLYFIPKFFLGGYFSRLLMWLCVGLMYLYTTKIEHQPLLLWKDSKRSVWHYLLGVITIYIAIIICGFVANRLLTAAGLQQQSTRLKEMLLYMRSNRILLVFTCLTAGIMEELLFRGYLMPRLQVVTGNKAMSIIISALMFGALHFSYGTITNVVGPVVIGLIFAIYYQEFRNLKVLMICHFLVDFIALNFMKA